MSKTTEIATTTGPWLKWAWRHFSLSVDEFDSYGEAIESANYMADAGEESLQCIEGPMGVVDPNKVSDDMHAISVAQQATYEERPKPTHGIKIAAPDGDGEAWYETYYNAERAERDAASLRERYGDRVRLFPIP